MPGPPGPRPRTSPAAKLAAGLTVCGLLYAAGSLHFRATTGQTDFSVFYRTAQALQHDMPAGFYGQQDEPTGLQHCIPPPGTMWFFFMPWLSIGTAALVWAALNLAFVVLSAWCLWRIYGALDRHQRLYRAIWLWAAALLAFLAIDSVQVGQFSVLFVACWLAYLAVDAAVPAASALMLPAMIKLYPALLLAVPVGLRRWRQVLAVPVAAVQVGGVLPGLLYGGRLPEMWRGFAETTFGKGGSRAVWPTWSTRTCPATRASMSRCCATWPTCRRSAPRTRASRTCGWLPTQCWSWCGV